MKTLCHLPRFFSIKSAAYRETPNFYLVVLNTFKVTHQYTKNKE